MSFEALSGEFLACNSEHECQLQVEFGAIIQLLFFPVELRRRQVLDTVVVPSLHYRGIRSVRIVYEPEVVVFGECATRFRAALL